MPPILAALLVLLLAVPGVLAEQAGAERPPAGILFNRSGLPATLPLQIRSEDGLDHAVFLRASDAETATMAGYVRGGAFFRLLVPPGDWQIRIASGEDWQGEGKLFGAATQWTDLPRPLSFGAGEARMNGHVLTLANGPDGVRIAATAPRRICRVPYWEGEVFADPDAADDPLPRRRYSGAPKAPEYGPDPLRAGDRRFRLRSVLCE